jgi:hypothetical protein
MFGHAFDRRHYALGVGAHQRHRVFEVAMRMHIDRHRALTVDHHRGPLGAKLGMLVRGLRVRGVEQAAGAEHQAGGARTFEELSAFWSWLGHGGLLEWLRSDLLIAPGGH